MCMRIVMKYLWKSVTVTRIVMIARNQVTKYTDYFSVIAITGSIKTFVVSVMTLSLELNIVAFIRVYTKLKSHFSAKKNKVSFFFCGKIMGI